ncbi:MAG: pirin family protein [PS1 clade bacterium]
MIEILDSTSTMEGQGVTVNRLFPVSSRRMNHDPFVLFDHFVVEQGQGFDTHPHRGFEAITFLFSGAMRHKDNLGNDSVVSAGGAQIFCAGKGISHSEMPEGEGDNNGIQFWISLEKKLKTVEPTYQLVEAAELPIISLDGVARTIIVGEGSPVRMQNNIKYEYMTIDQGKTYEIQDIEGESGLIYLISGSLEIEGEHLTKTQSILFDINNKSITLKAHSECQLMYASGRPHFEPIVQYGPYVD